jgi:hypothetical protein
MGLFVPNKQNPESDHYNQYQNQREPHRFVPLLFSDLSMPVGVGHGCLLYGTKQKSVTISEKK